jgi:hypothetical protein
MTGETSAPLGAHPSRFMLARFLAGGLDADMERDFHDHVRACDACDKKYSLARRSAGEFLSAHPEWESLRRSRPWPRRIPWVTETLPKLRFLAKWLALAPRIALGCLPLLACVWYLGVAKRAPRPDLTLKGEARFHLFVNGGRTAGDTLECLPSDTLQLDLISAVPMHYAVLYRDDDGSIRPYMENGKSKPLGKPGGENLPHSLVLQGGWKQEALFCLWSPRPFSLAEAQARIRDGQRVSGAWLQLQTFHLVNGRI